MILEKAKQFYEQFMHMNQHELFSLLSDDFTARIIVNNNDAEADYTKETFIAMMSKNHFGNILKVEELTETTYRLTNTGVEIQFCLLQARQGRGFLESGKGEYKLTGTMSLTFDANEKIQHYNATYTKELEKTLEASDSVECAQIC